MTAPVKRRSGRSLSPSERRANGLELVQGLWLPAELVSALDAKCARLRTTRTATIRTALEDITMTRKVTTFYEAADGTEPDITVEVEQEDRFTAVVCSDLDDLGVPEAEQPGVRDRAIEAYWEAERSAYLLSGQAERDGE